MSSKVQAISFFVRTLSLPQYASRRASAKPSKSIFSRQPLAAAEAAPTPHLLHVASAELSTDPHSFPATAATSVTLTASPTPLQL